MSKYVVAVYGTLMKGQPNHHWMMDAGGKFLMEERTSAPVNMVSLGAFPAISLESEDHVNANFAKVELWEVDKDGLDHLDKLEGYPNLYNRTQIYCGDVLAWIYHIETRDVQSAPPIIYGDWKRYTEERTGLQMTEELIGNA